MSRPQPSTEATRFYVGIALAVVLVVLVIWLRRDPTPKVAPRLIDDPKDDTLSMCAEGLAPVTGGGCYAAPATRPTGKALPLLLFLHGRYAPDAVDKMVETQARVARIARQRGATVLDFQFRNAVTGDDSRYWDPLHYRLDIARRIAGALNASAAGAAALAAQPDPFWTVLAAPAR